jgi:hypothetical protein
MDIIMSMELWVIRMILKIVSQLRHNFIRRKEPVLSNRMHIAISFYIPEVLMTTRKRNPAEK